MIYLGIIRTSAGPAAVNSSRCKTAAAPLQMPEDDHHHYRARVRAADSNWACPVSPYCI